jgi:glycosyltransferase involved in cell wall biosynthesis
VPVVASRIGGLPEVIENGVTGFLCPMGASDMMADRGIELLLDAGLRSRITRSAATLVRERFCADVVVPQYEAYYREVLATPPVVLEPTIVITRTT